MAKKLLVIGDLAIEMVMDLHRIPDPGDRLEEEKYLFLPGGQAGNAALTATYFGADAALCSRVGKDGNAERLRRFFEAAGIQTDAVFTESSSQTGLTITMNDAAYREARTIVYRGASAKLCTSDIDQGLAGMPDMVYLSAEVEDYSAGHAILASEEKGIPVFLDASSTSLLSGLYQRGARVQMLYTTDLTLETFSASPIKDVGSTLKCCLTLGQKLRADYYAVRMKNRGLFLYDGKTYNIAIVSDANEAKPKSGFADIEAAVLASEFLIHQNAYNACGFAAVADILAREVTDYRIPSRQAVTEYIRKHGLPFTI